MAVLLVILFVGVLFACLGGWIASQKGRETGEGVALGCLFGPLGCLIEALLPGDVSSPAPARVPGHTPTKTQAELDAEAIARETAFEAALSRMRAHDAQADADAKARRQQARADARSRRDQWYRDRGVEPGLMAWFRVLPDWAQMILIGICIAIPAIGLVAAIVPH